MKKDLTFDNFEMNHTNKFAFHACKETIKNLGKLYNPLILYGSNTKDLKHLLNACYNYIISDTDKKLLYVTGKELIDNLNNSKIDKYTNINILIIEDIQELENNSNAQKEFLHIFNNLYNEDKQIIMSSNKELDELNIEERLKTRTKWGLTVKVFDEQ